MVVVISCFCAVVVVVVGNWKWRRRNHEARKRHERRVNRISRLPEMMEEELLMWVSLVFEKLSDFVVVVLHGRGSREGEGEGLRKNNMGEGIRGGTGGTNGGRERERERKKLVVTL